MRLNHSAIEANPKDDSKGISSGEDGFRVKLYSMTQDDAVIEESKDQQGHRKHVSAQGSLFDAIKRESVCLSDYVDDKSVDSSKNNSLSPGREAKAVPLSKVNKTFGISMKDVR